MKKVYPDAASALAGYLKDDMTIMAGGFGLCGIPETLIEAIRDSGVKGLTVISNNAGIDNVGLGVLLETRQIRKMISSYVGENKTFAKQFLAGELEIEFNPQGTLAERCRAGGAGIPAFFTKTGVGTLVAEGKEVREFNGEQYVMETRPGRRSGRRPRLEGRHRRQPRLPQDRAQLQPDDGDGRQGHRGRGREPRAAGRDRSRPHRTRPASSSSASSTCRCREAHRAAHRPQARLRACKERIKTMAWTREEMAARAAKELQRRLLRQPRHRHPDAGRQLHPRGIEVTLQSENGMLGMGPFPYEGEEDPDLINAGKQTVTELPQTSYFSSADSFGMIRGGHIDLAILGAMQVSENGDLANWMIPGKMVKGMGGAMDLVAGVKRVVVVMEHASKDGEPKILKQCTLPLTGTGVVDLIITDMGVFQVDENGGGLTLIEIAPGVSVDDIKAKTEAEFKCRGLTNAG